MACLYLLNTQTKSHSRLYFDEGSDCRRARNHVVNAGWDLNNQQEGTLLFTGSPSSQVGFSLSKSAQCLAELGQGGCNFNIKRRPCS